MKKFNKYLLYALALLPVLVTTSCKDEEEIRFDFENDLQEAVGLRIVRSEPTFDSTDPEAATVLTYYSQNNNIDHVDVLADYTNFADGTTTAMEQLATLEGSEIDYDGSKTLTVDLDELTALFGMTPADLAGGDNFRLYHIVTLQDGRVYPDTILAGTKFETLNVDANIINASATHSFAPVLSFPVSCPIEDTSLFTGDYTVELIEGENNTAFGRLLSIPAGGTTVTLTNGGTNTQRNFSVGYLEDAVGENATTITLDFACNVVLVPLKSTGLACSSAGLHWVTNTANAGTFDIANDESFTVSLRHNPNSDCGLPTNGVYTLQFTKQ